MNTDELKIIKDLRDGCNALLVNATLLSPVERDEMAKLFASAPIMATLLEEEIKYLDMWMERLTGEGLMCAQMKERKEFIQMVLNKATL